jgi:hypothetical protein
MFRRRSCLLPLLALGACAARPVPSAPTPSVAEAPRRAVPASLSERVRRDAWMARFWSELTPAQRRRVLARLRQGNPEVANEEAAAPAWDALGLPERDRLLHGGAATRVAG